MASSHPGQSDHPASTFSVASPTPAPGAGWRTATRVCQIALAACAAGGVAPAVAAPLKMTLLTPQDDPRLERSRLERAYLGHPGGSAADGLKAALKEAQLELDAAGVSFTLDVVAVTSPETARAAAAQAEKAGHVAVLTDLGTAATLAAADAVKLPVLNLGNAENRLREADCRPRLLHLLPSERMSADALAQTLAASRWAQVLLLAGSSADDARRAAVAQAALQRYGLKLAGSKPFKLSADPRERDQANLRLLTNPGSSGTYDVIWVVDSEGEFARSLPYRSVLPRPVVGDAGLVPLAWHAQFERFGAPQVSRRFTKATQRPMTGQDWAAWLAGKALTAAAVAAPKGGPAFAQALATAELDGSKGVALSFRAWDGQLRQRLLLSDGQGVVALAPVEGVMHPTNSLDTLGADAPEKLCKARP